MIYADNAATTRLDEDAYEAMKPYLTNQYSNASQPYSFSGIARKALIEARCTIANCIGASPDEIYFTSCGTESNNWAVKMGAGAKGDIAVSSIEHHAVLNPCKTLERNGRVVKYIPVTHEGIVTSEILGKYITPSTRFISIMFANNEIGSIQPIKQLAETAHLKGALFHTDAVQAVGHTPLNVQEFGIDLLSASAHKFNGPKGVGFLYIRNGVQILPFLEGGNQEKSLRAGTENIAFIVAMAVALKKNCKCLEKTAERLNLLENIVIGNLKEANLDFIKNGSSYRMPGILSLSFRNYEGEMILHRLDIKGICISTGSACDSVNTQVSHVIKAIRVPQEYASGTIRISFGKDNTEEDANELSRALIAVLS